MKLQSKKAAVTGGAGFIGSHLVDRLLLADNHVVVVDDFSTGSLANLSHHSDDQRLRIVSVSVLDEDGCARAFAGIDAVFHLATRNVRLSLTQPTLVHEVNVAGTLNVLKASVRAGVRRVLYCSSSEVNGSADVVPMAEDYHFRPETIYGASKLAGEYYASVFHRAGWLRTVIARPHNNYGPREHFQGNKGEVIPRFVLAALRGEPLPVFGDGMQTRDFTYVVETAQTLIDLWECDAAAGQVLNVCRGEEVSILSLAKLVRELTRSASAIQHLPPRPSDVRRLFGDPTRLRTLLGRSPSISLREGLEMTIPWFRDKSALSIGHDIHNWQSADVEPWLAALAGQQRVGA